MNPAQPTPRELLLAAVVDLLSAGWPHTVRLNTLMLLAEHRLGLALAGYHVRGATLYNDQFTPLFGSHAPQWWRPASGTASGWELWRPPVGWQEYRPAVAALAAQLPLANPGRCRLYGLFAWAACTYHPDYLAAVQAELADSLLAVHGVATSPAQQQAIATLVSSLLLPAHP